MISVYCYRIDGLEVIPLLYPNFGRSQHETILFLNEAFEGMENEEPFVHVVEHPADADYILLAHNFSSLRTREDLWKELDGFSAYHKKTVIVFAHGDSDADVPLSSVITLRTSQYGYKKKSTDIMLPAYSPDLLTMPLQYRGKGGVPSVGFCGWAKYKNFKNRIGTIILNAHIRLQGLADSRIRVRRKGLSYRMDVVRILKKSSVVRANLILRSSYSGHSQTIKTDPIQARQEYVENIIGSDFGLAIKGDGNYSYRFYEILSLGRIPVLLDTDCVLPLEHLIDYDSFILRVPVEDLYEIDAYISENFTGMSNEEFVAMQHRAREAYEKYLKLPAYLRYVFTNFEEVLRAQSLSTSVDLQQ